MTDRKPRRNEKPLDPHPDPSVTVVNTHLADCFSGVKTKIATQMPIVARTIRVPLEHVNNTHSVSTSCLLFTGANQRTIRCRVFVVREQITPIIQSNAIDTNTVCAAVLLRKSVNPEFIPLGNPQKLIMTHGEYEYCPLL